MQKVIDKLNAVFEYEGYKFSYKEEGSDIRLILTRLYNTKDRSYSRAVTKRQFFDLESLYEIIQDMNMRLVLFYYKFDREDIK